MIGTADAPKILPVIGRLYEAAVDGSRWRDFLQDMAAAFASDGAQVVRVQPRNSLLSFSALYGYDEHLLRVYGPGDLQLATQRFERHFAELMPTDPRMSILQQYPSRPMSCRLAIPEAELHGSQIYKDMLRRADVEYSLVTSIAEEDGSLIILGVFRGRQSSHYTHDDVATFGELIPHLKQAITVSEQLAGVRFNADSALGALDSLGVGVFLVARDGRLIHGNSAGLAIAERRDAISLDAGYVHLSGSGSDQALARALAACFDDAGGSVAALVVQRPSGAAPIRITVSRLTDRVSGGPRQAAVLLFSLPEAPMETRVDLLRRLFGLTPAEARLCELLAHGQSLRDASGQLGMAISTARTHLKSIFSKLRVRRQAELIAKVTASPAWIHAATRGPFV